MIKITSQQNILLLAMRIIMKKITDHCERKKHKKNYYNFIGTVRVIFYNDVMPLDLVPGHSKNYIAVDKLSFRVSFLKKNEYLIIVMDQQSDLS